MRQVITILALILIVGGIVGGLWTGGVFTFERISETDKLMKDLNEKIDLPDEIPTIMTVEDKRELEGQEFFARAENGDKVIVFRQSGKAVLYRASIGKIIEIGPVNFVDEEAKSENSVKPRPVVAVYNGSQKPGAAGKFAEEILVGVGNFETGDRIDASGNYEETVVVAINENYTDEAKALAEGLEKKMIELPQREKEPVADILVIVGNDWR